MICGRCWARPEKILQHVCTVTICISANHAGRLCEPFLLAFTLYHIMLKQSMILAFFLCENTAIARFMLKTVDVWRVMCYNLEQ